jgi:hypothetical protein
MPPAPRPSGTAHDAPPTLARQSDTAATYAPLEHNAAVPDGSDVVINLDGPYTGPAEPWLMLKVLLFAFLSIHRVIGSKNAYRVRRELRDRRISALTRVCQLEGPWLQDARRAGLELHRAMGIYTRVTWLAVDLQWYPDRPPYTNRDVRACRTRAEEDGPTVDEWAVYYRMDDGPDKASGRPLLN